MSRILISYIIPFVLPAAIYAAWVWYRTAYAGRHGGEPPKLEQGPWPLLLFLGALLVFAILGATALTHGDAPDSKYIPPHLQGGEMIPGHAEPAKH